MKPLRLQAIAEAIGASYTGELTVCDVSSDTRAIGEGSLFVAIRGERFDGHAYINSALEGGAGLPQHPGRHDPDRRALPPAL